MQNEAVKKSAEQVKVSDLNNVFTIKNFANMVQGVANLTAVVATELIRTAANVTIFGITVIAKAAEFANKIYQEFAEILFDNPKDAKAKAELISMLKANPEKFLEFVKNAKEKLHENIEKLQQKLIEIKKSIAKISLALNRERRRYHVLSNRIDVLGEKLEKVRNKIKELEKQPGQEKNVEILKIKEREISNEIEELKRRRLEILNRIKELEEQKKKLEAEKDLIVQNIEECQDKIEKINSAEYEYKQAFNLEPEIKESLFERYRQNIPRKYQKMREENPTELSHGHLDFKAFIDTTTYNMQNLTSTKFSMRQEFEKKPSWIEERLQRANDNGFKVSSPSEQNHEHGGKDNMER